MQPAFFNCSRSVSESSLANSVSHSSAHFASADGSGFLLPALAKSLSQKSIYFLSPLWCGPEYARTQSVSSALRSDMSADCVLSQISIVSADCGKIFQHLAAFFFQHALKQADLMIKCRFLQQVVD